MSKASESTPLPNDPSGDSLGRIVSSIEPVDPGTAADSTSLQLNQRGDAPDEIQHVDDTMVAENGRGKGSSLRERLRLPNPSMTLENSGSVG